MIIFRSVRFGFYQKKITKSKFKKKNIQNWFKPTGFGSVFQDKNRFKPVQLGFFGLARFFSGLGSVRFFRFQAYKTEPASFLKILFYFFLYFFNLISFLIFLLGSRRNQASKAWYLPNPPLFISLISLQILSFIFFFLYVS